jgi:hypothetical protein
LLETYKLKLDGIAVPVPVSYIQYIVGLPKPAVLKAANYLPAITSGLIALCVYSGLIPLVTG